MLYPLATPPHSFSHMFQVPGEIFTITLHDEETYFMVRQAENGEVSAYPVDPATGSLSPHPYMLGEFANIHTWEGWQAVRKELTAHVKSMIKNQE